jgi:predicted heme/steroid binding protein
MAPLPKNSLSSQNFPAMMRQAAVRLAAGAGVGAAGYIAYDYQTCHPMRKMQGYELGGAWIRFHNTMRPRVTLREMTLKELATFNGEAGRPVYFSSDGKIWDVSTSENFQQTYGLWKGKDASVALAKMSMDRQDVNRTDWENLSENELESLRSWTTYFQEKYIIKGRLKGFQTNKS